MRSFCFLVFVLALGSSELLGQIDRLHSCDHDEIISRMSLIDGAVTEELSSNEEFIDRFVRNLHQERLQGDLKSTTYTIPIVIHVFHDGDDALLDMDQIQSGIDVLNTDIQGLNSDWNTVIPQFDSIKAALDIEFCLAKIDPEGNPTTGVNYYDDEAAMLNQVLLQQYAWDNYSYLNIYLPKYSEGAPSLFTAYAYYPSTSNSDNGYDGVIYSSIRWGYGAHSELSPGQEWASVITHEVGHWLNLRHTFDGGCSGAGDLVDDTPPTTGGTIELSGCYNNDFSCGVATNGSNYMDYNHDCKKMFTQGQVDRMIAALNLPSRITLWSPENLNATGCTDLTSELQEVDPSKFVRLYPNPAHDMVIFEFEGGYQILTIYSMEGELLEKRRIFRQRYEYDCRSLAKGIYFYSASDEKATVRGKFILE